MRAEYFNPFISATVEVFRTMLGCELTRGQLGLKSDSSPAFEVSGMIGISGGMHGMVVVSLSRETAISATEKMLGERPDTLNGDVTDAVGEIANMIAGAAKTKFGSSALSIGLPTVVCGENHQVTFPSQSTPMTLPFDSDLGSISVEIGLAESAC
ncbi:MAG TPA: chemotaxis protein CheX [Pirellulaceae bacterium]|jgi:chemotaxis protein CheX|nr:chemotaxis protein CheX [Pirellulaceae bacterium]